MLALVENGKECVEAGYDVLSRINHMKALTREYYFLPYSEEVKFRIKVAKKEYKRKYPRGSRARSRIKTNFSPFTMHCRHLRWLLFILLREKRGYRVMDHLLILHLLAYFMRFLFFPRPGILPEFIRDSAMGIETIFR